MRKRNKELPFKTAVIVYIPYLLLKFLIQEKCLTEFLESCKNSDYICLLKAIFITRRDNPGYYEPPFTLFRQHNLKISFRNAFNFNNYWYRRYWKFEEFVEEYEKAHSK